LYHATTTREQRVPDRARPVGRTFFGRL